MNAQHGPRRRAAGAAAFALALLTAGGRAAASSGIDSPESGVEQVGRGSAWLARADDPLAVYFNPAALAYQSSGVHLGAQLMFMNRCFTRKGDGGAPVSPGNNLPGPGAPPDPNRPKQVAPAADVCSKAGAFPNPQLAATFRLGDRVGLGIGVVAPHATGSNVWPESVPYTHRSGEPLTQPAPNRYLLVSNEATIIFPTVSVGFALTDTLSVGAGFLWGIATIHNVNFSEGISPLGSATGITDRYENSDARTELTAKDLFIPGFVLSALWSATSNLDVAAWFKWTDRVRADHADLRLTTPYWDASLGTPAEDVCAGSPDPQCNVTDAKGKGSLTFTIPMEAKLALRYHMTRKDADRPALAADGTSLRRVRDPLRDDLFDVELDFTWANNSAVDSFEVRFPTGAQAITIKGAGTTVPENADIPRKWKDVVGVRLGGDLNILRSRLALRAGGFFETKGQRDDYLALDFDLAERIGLSGGATVRLGPVDVSAAYQHTFFGTLDNGGKGAVHALSGQRDAGFRSRQAINGGVLKASLNEIGLSGTVRF
jgi:long-chain fatty acid transport protein